MKVNFIVRLGAYLIDIILISILLSFLTQNLSNARYKELQKDSQDLIESYETGDLSMTEYIEENKLLLYEMNKNSIWSNVISIVLTIGYFVVFQFLNKGQTLGKKLLKIRIVENDSSPSLKAMILRSIITLGIISGILNIIFVLILRMSDYLYAYYFVNYVSYIFILICGIMILYRKDKKGLHDIMANTEVISERG